ncbi:MULTISPECIES: hypothetical protein [Nonomuraea]|uniref:CHASE3 domain sensor protein n=2 Tax=Nonomuraea TaxID=83681 RepID=A0A7W5Y8H1_9ACTN|nr:hypothetical protein [Nonomuraea dietziae]MBB3728478.1 CHASE3 domain sensor protein [Nonomuraea dietziae]
MRTFSQKVLFALAIVLGCSLTAAGVVFATTEPTSATRQAPTCAPKAS